MRPWPLTAIGAALAAVLTVVFVAWGEGFAYRSLSLHVAFEVAAALIATLAAYLVFGRFRTSSALADLALVCGLATMAAANMFFAALPAAVGDDAAGRWTWAAIAGRLLSALLLAVAAFAPSTKLRHPSADARAALAVCGSVVAAVALLVAELGSSLPRGLDPAVSPNAVGREAFVAHDLVHAVQVLAALLFAAAAVGFTRRATRGDAFARWLAPACVLAAFARVHYFLFPSLYSEWVYTGDGFRLAFYVVLLAGAAREITAYQQRAEQAAVLEERRRLARDLHDGLAQELAYIVLQARSRIDAAPTVLEPIAAAAERAVDEARRAIAALTRDVEETLDVAVAEAVEDVAHRTGARVQFDLESDVRVDPDVREQLLRIVREAVTNATRHGKANVVRVELVNGTDVLLRIRDDGVGFDTSKGRVGGHGLIGMRERAQTLGAQLTIESSEDGGTHVEIVLPRSS